MLKIPTFSECDLPVRRQQAALGLVSAGANVKLAEIDTVYGVQDRYVSYLYARSQRLAIENAQSGLLDFRATVHSTIHPPKEQDRQKPSGRVKPLRTTPGPVDAQPARRPAGNVAFQRKEANGAQRALSAPCGKPWEFPTIATWSRHTTASSTWTCSWTARSWSSWPWPAGRRSSWRRSAWR